MQKNPKTLIHMERRASRIRQLQQATETCIHASCACICLPCTCSYTPHACSMRLAHETKQHQKISNFFKWWDIKAYTTNWRTILYHLGFNSRKYDPSLFTYIITLGFFTFIAYGDEIVIIHNNFILVQHLITELNYFLDSIH